MAAGGRLWHDDAMSDAPPPDAGTDEPMAPTSEVWATLNDAQRQRVLATLVPIPRSQMPPVGDPHINAERIAESSLGGCTGDIDRDGTVGSADLALLLAAWGNPKAAAEADLTGDGVVDAADLGTLLEAWGACAP